MYNVLYITFDRKARDSANFVFYCELYSQFDENYISKSFLNITLTFFHPGVIINKHYKNRGRSSVAEHQLPKLNMRVRFPSPAPGKLE